MLSFKSISAAADFPSQLFATPMSCTCRPVSNRRWLQAISRKVTDVWVGATRNFASIEALVQFFLIRALLNYIGRPGIWKLAKIRKMES